MVRAPAFRTGMCGLLGASGCHCVKWDTGLHGPLVSSTRLFLGSYWPYREYYVLGPQNWEGQLPSCSACVASQEFLTGHWKVPTKRTFFV